MEEIKSSYHKNYLPSYPGSFEDIIKDKILLHPWVSFKLFSEKFLKDAKKDWERGRKLLERDWKSISELCSKLGELYVDQDNWDNEDAQLVEEVVNMDYQSVAWFFALLKDIVGENNSQKEYFDKIIWYLNHLWRLSENHTIIIKKEISDILHEWENK